MIYDFFKMSGDSEAILDFRDLSKVQCKNDNVQVFDAKWHKVSSAVTDRPADNILESLCKMQVDKSEKKCRKSTLKRRHSATRNVIIAD